MRLVKLATSIASLGLVVTLMAPAVSAASLEISGNGAKSDNTIIDKSACVGVVLQSNKTTANTFVVSSASTGGNTASGNTGGSTSIDTGKATSNVTVSVTGGDNSATLPSCCECSGGNDDVLISGNGYRSDNKVVNKDLKLTVVAQKEKTKANTFVVSKAKTGYNKAKHNTDGDVTVTTDDSESTVDVTVAGGSNSN